jgi:hypothetical protein
VTTITTVGFGDIYAISTEERIMGCIFKLFGVLMFSITSGFLTQIIMSDDANKAKINEKLTILDRLKNKYSIRDEIYHQIRLSVNYETQENDEEMQDLAK